MTTIEQLREKLAGHVPAELLAGYLRQAAKVKVTTEQAKAFLQNVEPLADGCWKWHGKATKDGLPFFYDCPPGPARLPTKQPMAHRTAFAWFRGTLRAYPHWKLVQTCDHRWCVNPSHLQQQRVREREPFVFRLALEQVIDPHLELEPASGCWFWTGNLNALGYAVAEIAGALRSIDLVLFEGLIGFGENQSASSHQVFHRCGHRSCVNPLHMDVVPRGQRRVLEKTPEVSQEATT